MKRREFISLLGGAAATWPLAARAQQAGLPRIGVLSGGADSRSEAFKQGLHELGYIAGRNIAIEWRFAVDQERTAIDAADLVSPALAQEPGGGLIVSTDPFINPHRGLVMTLAERHRLPAIYGLRQFVSEGALITYGPDSIDIVRRSASYVDRILKGERPADLPVQAPTKYELTINLKTAKALGLDVPAKLVALADEVIE